MRHAFLYGAFATGKGYKMPGVLQFLFTMTLRIAGRVFGQVFVWFLLKLATGGMTTRLDGKVRVTRCHRGVASALAVPLL